MLKFIDLLPSLMCGSSVSTVLTVAAVYGHMKQPMKTLYVKFYYFPSEFGIDDFLVQVGSW